MVSVLRQKCGKTPVTVGFKPQSWLKSAWAKLALFAGTGIRVKGIFSDGRRGCRFLTSGGLPVFTNRRLKCPVPLKHSLHSASLHSYLHVQVSRKSLLYTNQLLLSQYPASCNFVRGGICSAPDTSRTGIAALPQGLISDNTPCGVAAKRKICYHQGTVFTFLWSKICLALKQLQACVSHWLLSWEHARNKWNRHALRRNLSITNMGMWSAAKVAGNMIRPLSKKIRACRRKMNALTRRVQTTLANRGTTTTILSVLSRNSQPDQRQAQSTKRIRLTDYLYPSDTLNAFSVTTNLRGELPC